MAKTNEELQEIEEEYKALATKLQELTNEELVEVTGGQADFNSNFSPAITIVGAIKEKLC